MPLPQKIIYHAFLDSSGTTRKAHIRREADCWPEFQRENEACSFPYRHLDEFLTFMQESAYLKQTGELPSIIGISLEGPLLASFGGTSPTRS